MFLLYMIKNDELKYSKDNFTDIIMHPQLTTMIGVIILLSLLFLLTFAKKDNINKIMNISIITMLLTTLLITSIGIYQTSQWNKNKDFIISDIKKITKSEVMLQTQYNVIVEDKNKKLIKLRVINQEDISAGDLIQYKRIGHYIFIVDVMKL